MRQAARRDLASPCEDSSISERIARARIIYATLRAVRAIIRIPTYCTFVPRLAQGSFDSAVCAETTGPSNRDEQSASIGETRRAIVGLRVSSNRERVASSRPKLIVHLCRLTSTEVGNSVSSIQDDRILLRQSIKQDPNVAESRCTRYNCTRYVNRNGSVIPIRSMSPGRPTRYECKHRYSIRLSTRTGDISVNFISRQDTVMKFISGH